MLHIAALWFQYETGNLEVAESATLHFEQQFVGQFLKGIVILQFMLQVYDMLQTLQEPDINLREMFDALNGVTLFECLSDGEDTEVGRISQFLIEVVELRMVVANESVHTLTNHAETLLDHLLERAADTHNLTHRLHRRTDLTAHASELREVPAGYLTNHIVEARSHVGR